MDLKNYVIADVQIGGFVFEFKMPGGCTFGAAQQACLEIAKNIEALAKQAETQQKATVVEDQETDIKE